jgi:hypothetical protein
MLPFISLPPFFGEGGVTALLEPRPPSCGGFEIICGDMHHTRKNYSGRGIGPFHRPLSDNTKLSQETGIHVLGGIRIRNPSKRATSDLILGRAATRVGTYNFLPTLMSITRQGRVVSRQTHRGCSGPIPGQSTWDLWYTKWKWGRLLS